MSRRRVAGRTGAGRLPASDGPRSITILGATGSIGRSTLDLIGRTPERFRLRALTANGNAPLLAELARRHEAELAVVADSSAYGELKEALSGSATRVAAGPEGVREAAALQADWTMAAIVGAAGLVPTLEAVARGGRLALANKECLVAAGDLFMRACARSRVELLPVDSEHSAAFQAIAGAAPETIEEITLTASGGPFRATPIEALARVTPEEALRHPKWSMGAKITIDSATLMNKGLELIEAFHLFPVEAEQIRIVVHPQSIVHSLVSFRDGSVLAQLAEPDMRTPIALSLAWPGRMQAPTRRLDLVALGSLTFEAPDERRFRAPALARHALAAGGSACAVLNAANEVAVEAFLGGRIGFLDIARIVEEVLGAAEVADLPASPSSIGEVIETDAIGRRLALARVGRAGG